MQSQQETKHTSDNSPKVGLDILTPYKDIPKKYPHLFSESSWAWKVKQRHHNGLGKAFRKVGKDLFVNDIVLAECIDEQTEGC